MPVASQEEQFKFLISCIRYSNNGKVNYFFLPFSTSYTEAGPSSTKEHKNTVKELTERPRLILLK